MEKQPRKRLLPAENTTLRLNQAIAKTGYCSRRKADELIAAGRVSVNDKRSNEFNQQINLDKDRLTIDGKPIYFKRHTYVIINKPKGIVTTSKDTHERKIVIDLLPKDLKHLRPVGRLDMYSTGLLLLTNDGELANKLMHPSSHIAKTYLVKVEGKLKREDIQQLESGIMLEDGMTQPCQLNKLIFKNELSTQFTMTIYEGRNRQIRRMLTTLGYTVIELSRLSLGKLQLGELKSGAWRHLSKREIDSLIMDSKTIR